MEIGIIASLIKKVDQTNLSADLFYLAKNPLPCRTLNFTLPGHTKCTLHEADDFIEKKLTAWGYEVGKEAVPVQVFRPDNAETHGFRKPKSSEPWYDAYNLYAKKVGKNHPDELVVVIAHKDSQSWLNCAPGAHDNAVGTVGTLEIARLLSDYASHRSIWFIFCNEEHWPWTSVTVAQNLAKSDFEVIAALNIDGIGGRSRQDRAGGRMVNVTRFSSPEGERFAELMTRLNERYHIGLIQKKYYCAEANDDDGSFIKAGMPASVLNIGSFPYAEPNYHSEKDVPENVDLQNVKLATQLSLAAVMHLDIHGNDAMTDKS